MAAAKPLGRIDEKRKDSQNGAEALVVADLRA